MNFLDKEILSQLLLAFKCMPVKSKIELPYYIYNNGDLYMNYIFVSKLKDDIYMVDIGQIPATAKTIEKVDEMINHIIDENWRDIPIKYKKNILKIGG